MTYNIETDFLSNDEAERLYKRLPELKNDCPTCRGEHWILTKGSKEYCQCSRQLQLAKHYGAAGIPVPYLRLGWEDYHGDPNALTKVQEYVEHAEDLIWNGMGLIFHGPNGIGKTMLATLLLKDLIKLGHRGYSTTFNDMIEAFTRTWTSESEKEWFAQKFMRIPILLLDDLGKERRNSSKLSETTFDNILRTRVHEGRVTLLTTNMSMAELLNGYGASAFSLLREVSLEIPVKGTDYRDNVASRKLEDSISKERRPIT